VEEGELKVELLLHSTAGSTRAQSR
jgi:hypothetical protein